MTSILTFQVVVLSPSADSASHTMETVQQIAKFSKIEISLAISGERGTTVYCVMKAIL